jgi:hypothetical protein
MFVVIKITGCDKLLVISHVLLPKVDVGLPVTELQGLKSVIG